MAPTEPFVFISCGQYLPHEKQLGFDIKKAIEELTPFQAYFAEDQSSANGLVANILERLFHCAGFVMVMHPRGEVKNDLGHIHVRGSLWIEQEIAIVSLIQHFVRKDTEIKIAAYVHQSIKREGIRELIHLNPIPFDRDDVILPDLRSRLPNWQLSATAAIKTQRWERWEEGMRRLRPEDIEALRILTLDGPANDAAVTPRLKRMGLAQNWYVVLPELTTNSPFVQVVPGQPPARRQRDGERMYEIKSEAKEFLGARPSNPLRGHML
jgi:hypothetical protein